MKYQTDTMTIKIAVIKLNKILLTDFISFEYTLFLFNLHLQRARASTSFFAVRFCN